jgi:hypothetical protein
MTSINHKPVRQKTQEELHPMSDRMKYFMGFVAGSGFMMSVDLVKELVAPPPDLSSLSRLTVPAKPVDQK